MHTPFAEIQPVRAETESAAMKTTHLNPGRTLVPGLGILIIITLAMGIFSLKEISTLTGFTEKMYLHPLAVSNAARDIRADIISMHRSMKDVALAQNDEQRNMAVKEVAQLEQDVLHSFDIIDERFLGDKREIFIARRSFIEWKTIRDEVISLQKSGFPLKAALITKGKGAVHVYHMNKNIQVMIEFATRKGEDFFKASQAKSKQTQLTMIILLIAAISAAILVVFIISRIWLEAEKKSNNESWQKNGIEQLNITMQGSQDIQPLSRDIILFLTKYLNAMIGALYIHDQGQKQLVFTAGYGVDISMTKAIEIPIGQGIIGEAAQSQKLIHISDIQENNFHLNSVSGATTPQHIIAVPFTKDNTVTGVIELGSLNPFSASQIQFLEDVLPFIANAITVCQARMQLSELLEESTSRTSQLELQEQNLILANTSLESKSKELSEQREELRRTNEELEKQTQLLVVEKTNLSHQNLVLEKTRKEVEKKAEEVATASRYKSEFLANMSHELRTPLNSIILLSQHLSRNKANNLTEKQVECASTVYSSGTELLTLINEILDLAKVESGKLQLSVEKCDITNIAASMDNIFQPLAHENGVEFVIDVPLIMIEGFWSDCRRISQILKNLLANAFKFTKSGRITLRICVKDDVLPVKMIVQDTGIGIARNKLETIFQAFRQEDGSTSREYGGTGLGLSISKELAALLGGTLEVESTPGQGSIFTLSLPKNIEDQSVEIMQTPDVTPAITGINIDIRDSAEPKTSNENDEMTYVTDDRNDITKESRSILIIEPNPNYATILCSSAREKGFMALIAETGESGLHLTNIYEPDAIILDLELSGMSGMAVLFRLKDNLNTRHIPVLILSDRNKDLKPIHMGALGFLKKPVTTKSIDKAFSNIEKVLSKETKKVLIIEDDEPIRSAIQGLIEDGTAQVTTAVNGKAAQLSLGEEDFDCVIIDLEVPDMNGYGLIKDLRHNNHSYQTSVIVHTAKVLTTTERQMLDTYADSIVIKDIRSLDRLFDKTCLFLHRAATNLPEDQNRIIRQIHDQKTILENKKILIVDDDIRNIFSLVSILEEKGLTTVTAENGAIAIEKLKEHTDIDIVLMDIMMPVMNGYEAMAEIRNLDSEISAIGIIALTAKAMRGDRVKCIAAGASDYLSKPVDTEQLFSMLRVWLY